MHKNETAHSECERAKKHVTQVAQLKICSKH